LLQRGAKGVVAVDVGYGQLNEKLRTDGRVRVLDRKNARYLGLQDLPENPLLATIDVSFISTTLILPALALAAPNAALVVMVKPQFELDRAKVGKGGVVRDDRLRYEALAKVVNKANDLGFAEVGHVESELPGPKGNREIFAHFVRENP
jgi:23S rRNA (cytidine1920-2'-O)/16S rRNA (cytidine1409-2'-O)-methyltransferase